MLLLLSTFRKLVGDFMTYSLTHRVDGIVLADYPLVRQWYSWCVCHCINAAFSLRLEWREAANYRKNHAHSSEAILILFSIIRPSCNEAPCHYILPPL